jgi:hypothetical protein
LERLEPRANGPFCGSLVGRRSILSVCRRLGYRHGSRRREAPKPQGHDEGAAAAYIGCSSQEAGNVMGMDVVALGLAVVFFALSVALIALCERL